jgi:hypothetical protein
MKLGEAMRAAGFKHVMFEPLPDQTLANYEIYGNPRNFLDIDR